MPPRVIQILVFPNVQLLDVSGPFQVFASANAQAQRIGKEAPYQVYAVSVEGGLVNSSSGLVLQTQPLPVAGSPCDTFIIAGGWGVHTATGDPVLVEWATRHACNARRVASVCTGAFMLASTGLLDGRRAVTHWNSCEALAERFPAITVDPDPIFVNEDKWWTSAGVTAGIDLALALVEQDLGHAHALAVARDLVVFLKRPGGQAQFSATLSLQQRADKPEQRFADLHAWIADNLTGNLSVGHLAARAGMSERSFVRHYHSHTGMTPARAVEHLRVEAARRMLGDGGLPLKRIADRCGFGSEETLRRCFFRRYGVNPQAWRERFQRN